MCSIVGMDVLFALEAGRVWRCARTPAHRGLANERCLD